MKCIHCTREVALAKVCPYCGKSVPQEDAAQRHDEDRAGNSSRGAFKVRIGRNEHVTGESVFRLIPDALRYFRDPGVAKWRKTMIIAGILYVVSPVDLVPGALMPLLGWLDDAVVATFAWRMLSSELERYRKNPVD